MVVVHSGSQWFSVTAVSSSSPSNEGGKDMNARYFWGDLGRITGISLGVIELGQNILSVPCSIILSLVVS